MATFDQSDFTPRLQQGESQETTRLVGFEMEVKRKDNQKDAWLHNAVASIDGFAQYGYDGDDIEVVSDPISTSLLVDNSFIKSITDELVKNECDPCTGGGTHINVSKLPSDSKYTYENLIWLQIVFEEQLQKVFGRITTWAQSPVKQMMTNTSRSYKRENFVKSPLFKQILDINFGIEGIPESFSKRFSKSLMVTDKGNRYEFRGGKSSVDELELLAWGEFCVNLVKAAAKSSIKGIKFSQFFKGPHIEKYFADVIQKAENRKLKDADLAKTAKSTQKITITNKRNRVY